MNSAEMAARAQIASTRHTFQMSERELSELLAAGVQVNLTVPGGALIWEAGECCPEAVVQLAKMRGVFDENFDGNGI